MCMWLHVEQKGKSQLDFDFQYEYKLRKHPLVFKSFKLEVSEKLPH